VPRPLTGKLRVNVLSDGRGAFYARVRGTERLIGQEPHWTETRAYQELTERIVPAAKLGQPWWERYGSAALIAADHEAVELREVASELVAQWRTRYPNPATRNAKETPLVKHVVPFMAYYDDERERPRPMSDVTPRLIDRFIAAKVAEREVLRELPDTLGDLADEVLRSDELLAAQLDAEEFRLLCAYGQRSKHGKRSLSSRGLSNNEINRCLDRVRTLVRLANMNHKLGLDDPTVDKYLPGEDPPRDWLRPDQLEAIFDAAAELDAKAKRYETNRTGIVTVLAIAGPRVSELGGMRPEHVSLTEEIIRIPEAKTTAGRRDLQMHRAVRDAVEATMGNGAQWLFPTDNGTRRDRNNLRERVLGPVLARAAELLAARGQRPLPRVTPHTFRRTYLTYLAWAQRPQRFAMAQAGHKDAKLTLEVYQQPMPRKLDPRVTAWLAD
jgi:integrase